MAQTGEKYTEARRAMEGAPAGPPTGSERTRADRPAGSEFGRFTEGAWRVVVLARDEARALEHDVVGSEHILLGLLREQDGIAARVLGLLHVTVAPVRAALVERAGRRDGVAAGRLEFTAGAKAMLELALREAFALGDNYIGTEHILLALVRDSDGVAVDVLLAFGAAAEKVRSEVIGVLSGVGYRPPGEAGPAAEFSGMFERFTVRARKVMELAELESIELGHDRVGGEHILLGLLREREGLAGRALEALGVTLERARAAVLEQVPAGKPATAGGRLLTPRAKRVVERALREALALGHDYIGAEHILLGLLREGESNAIDILVALDVEPGKVRAEVLSRLSAAAADPSTQRSQPRKLTAQEEVELAMRIERGDLDAIELLAQANRQLVVSIADEYRGQGLSFEELKRAGNRGLLRATDKFDHRIGHRFSSYAAHWIRQAIVQALTRQSR